MSLLTYNFESQYLNNNHTITVILPDKKRDVSPEEFYLSGTKYKVLWLLHGTFGDHTDWIRKTNIELYAAEKNLVVVCPSALNSNYSNWPDAMMGYNMYDYFTKELMPLIYGWMPVSDKREDNFIAGLSMGGRGTIKFAVNYPELFSAAAVFSAVPVPFDELRPGHPCMIMDTNNPRMVQTIHNAGGFDAYINSEENVWALIDKLAPAGKLPRLMFACGHEDTLLYERYQIFQKHCTEIGLNVTWFDLPEYKHEWRFWDLAIQRALDFFGLDENGCGNPF
ncbi:esterase family protein [Mediterraneibacter sp. NSJ-55]|uniref:Esterase family protein n=1 Tax=Mediterraneibacter hominis TaxID=2763054 RepID=A0A923LJT3_9FIRM|nr:alpha/beta hydrolase family protein [Mediterraneibacter hominis]MBC5689585.1 esterase family protein [Mediterraneibacter hominis]